MPISRLMPLLRRGALALLTSLLFAGSFIAGKYTTADLGPLTTALLRYIIASGLLAVLMTRSPHKTAIHFACALRIRAIQGGRSKVASAIADLQLWRFRPN